MHYHHPVHGERVFRSLEALEAYCEKHGGDPKAVRFCLDESCR